MPSCTFFLIFTCNQIVTEASALYFPRFCLKWIMSEMFKDDVTFAEMLIGLPIKTHIRLHIFINIV